MGYCPFSSLGHDTTDCIVTQGRAGAVSRRGDMTPRRCDTTPRRCDTTLKRPAIRPAGPRHGRPTCGASGSPHAHGLATVVCHDTKFCIVAEGQPLCRDTGCDTTPSALRYGTGALRYVQ